jgi:hypothetical protein
VKIVNLRPIPTESGRTLYSFTAVLEGFLVNGFLYNAETGSIAPPQGLHAKGRSHRMVNAFGVHWNRMRDMVKKELTETVDTMTQ